MVLKRIIDKNTNLFLRDAFTHNDKCEIALDTKPSQGLYRPKWDGIRWVEGMPQAEIDELNNQPSPLTENEMIMLAIADLAEIVLGGM